MSVLYMIRHAESEANKKRILASHEPYPLTLAGREDAARIAAELKELTLLDAIICSPLVRAMQTAEPFARLNGLPITQDKRLAEQNLGVYSGMTYDEVKALPMYRQDKKDRWDWKPPGNGESYRELSERVKDFFKSLEDPSHDGKRILVVTHAVVFRLIRAVLENTLPIYPEEFPNNGEIWKVHFTHVGDFHRIESLKLGYSSQFVHKP